MSLDAFRHWSGQYKNFLKQNANAFEDQGLAISRAYLDKLIDSRLATRLRDDEGGNKKVMDTTSVEDILEMLEQMYLDAKPL